MFDEAVKAEKNVNIVILTFCRKYGWGAHCTICEGIDSDHINLPGIHEDLLVNGG